MIATERTKLRAVALALACVPLSAQAGHPGIVFFFMLIAAAVLAAGLAFGYLWAALRFGLWSGIVAAAVLMLAWSAYRIWQEMNMPYVPEPQLLPLVTGFLGFSLAVAVIFVPPYVLGYLWKVRRRRKAESSG